MASVLPEARSWAIAALAVLAIIGHVAELQMARGSCEEADRPKRASDTQAVSSSPQRGLEAPRGGRHTRPVCAQLSNGQPRRLLRDQQARTRGAKAKDGGNTTRNQSCPRDAPWAGVAGRVAVGQIDVRVQCIGQRYGRQESEHDDRGVPDMATRPTDCLPRLFSHADGEWYRTVRARRQQWNLGRGENRPRSRQQ